MPNKCNSDPEEIWVSTTSTGLDGAFIITSVDDAGNFEGKHSGDKIKGLCTGTHISYRRPATSSRFEYSGKFNPAKDRLKGKRRSLVDSKKLTDDEEWEGVKTTTLVNKKPSRLRKGGKR